MGESKAERVKPVNGTTFATSHARTIGLIALGVFFVLVAVVIGATGLGLFPGGRPPSLRGIVGMAILGPLGLSTVGLGIYFLMRRRRLVVGADRFQLIQRAGGEDMVVVQVMFSNITGLVLNCFGQAKSMLVHLANSVAEGTLDAAWVIRQRSDGRGNEIVIPDEYRGGIKTLLETLDAAVIRWQAKRPE